ncbi:MAG: hypothetical protein BGO01_16615 [Armatimonadetes bacterium 55-13]|nr:class D beta-lactamase [Armatimonadota bacterium]OJU65480.1 MAG: hypothetical protein BGO01_16615 [Armatimonadetes bacterium 55-13]
MLHLLPLLFAPQTDFATWFKGYDACFILRETGTGKETIYNAKRVNQAFPPCSTFKIPNSLIGLETGVVKDENTLFKWDGKDKGREAWNQDHTLASAFENSVLWYYQRIARSVGPKRMQFFVDRLGYGNRDISGGIDKFWLMSSMKITARQQVDLLQSIYAGKVPFSQRSQTILRKIMVIEDKPGHYTFSGKTGSGNGPNGIDLGWFVGSIKTGGKRYVFATNITGKTAWGPEARRITKEILADLNLLR